MGAICDIGLKSRRAESRWPGGHVVAPQGARAKESIQAVPIDRRQRANEIGILIPQAVYRTERFTRAVASPLQLPGGAGQLAILFFPFTLKLLHFRMMIQDGALGGAKLFGKPLALLD